MSKQKTHTPRTLCKSLTQLRNIAKNSHYNEHFTKEESKFIYDIYNKSFDIRRRLMLEHNLDIHNDYRDV
jgi:hypothetical protein